MTDEPKNPVELGPLVACAKCKWYAHTSIKSPRDAYSSQAKYGYRESGDTDVCMHPDFIVLTRFNPISGETWMQHVQCEERNDGHCEQFTRRLKWHEALWRRVKQLKPKKPEPEPEPKPDRPLEI